MAEDEQKTFMDKSTIYKWLDEIDKANRHSPPVTSAKLRKNLQKRFGKNWNREYSPTGNIGDDLDKMLKMRRARKGGPVGHRVGEQVTPNSKGGNLTGSVLGVPQMNPSTPPLSSIPSPPSVQKRPASVKKQPSKEEQMAKKIDASNKIAAAKAEDVKVAQRKSLGQPQGKPPGPPGMSQPQAPRAMVRKGGSINPQGYKRGGKVYANICRPANHSEA